MFHSLWSEEQTCKGNVQTIHKQHEQHPTDVPPHWPPYLVQTEPSKGLGFTQNARKRNKELRILMDSENVEY